MEKNKIKLEDLTDKSTPCEICVALNNREITPNTSRNYLEEGHCLSGWNTSKCLDSDKAMIKLLYLNYRK